MRGRTIMTDNNLECQLEENEKSSVISTKGKWKRHWCRKKNALSVCFANLISLLLSLVSDIALGS